MLIKRDERAASRSARRRPPVCFTACRRSWRWWKSATANRFCRWRRSAIGPRSRIGGFMMDFSHGQLLRVSEIERQIDLSRSPAFKGEPIFLSIRRWQHRDGGLRTGRPGRPLHARRNQADHRLRAPAAHGCRAVHGTLRSHARFVSRGKIFRPRPAALRR